MSSHVLVHAQLPLQLNEGLHQVQVEEGSADAVQDENGDKHGQECERTSDALHQVMELCHFTMNKLLLRATRYHVHAQYGSRVLLLSERKKDRQIKQTAREEHVEVNLGAFNAEVIIDTAPVVIDMHLDFTKLHFRYVDELAARGLVLQWTVVD